MAPVVDERYCAARRLHRFEAFAQLLIAGFDAREALNRTVVAAGVSR